MQTRYPEPSLGWPSPTRRTAGRARKSEQSDTATKTLFDTMHYNATSKYLIYLGDFDPPVLFLGLVCGGIVVSGTVIINQFPVPLSYTCLKSKEKMRKKMSPNAAAFLFLIFQVKTVKHDQCYK